MPRRPTFVDIGHSLETVVRMDSEGISFGRTEYRPSNNGMFLWSNNSDDDSRTMPSAAEKLVRTSEDSALVLIEDYEGLTKDMIFNKAEYMGDNLLKVTCIFSRFKHEECFEKEYVIPYENLMTYSEAIDTLKREYIQEGDLVIGLATSSIYSITSHRSCFIGSALPSRLQMFRDGSNTEETFYVHHRYGQASVNLKTVFSTEGRPGETHYVNADCFIPCVDPGHTFRNMDLGLSEVLVLKETDGLKKGFIYPIDSVQFVNKGLEVVIVGQEKGIKATGDYIKLIGKGEL